MHFVLTDPSVEFHMMFRDGKIVGDLGAPAETPELRLKMKAEILDKMFTGKINPTKAAMTGKMSFSGDTRKAMGMQRIQGDLCRLYIQAREEVGGPGDLRRHAALPAAPAVAVPAAAVRRPCCPAARHRRRYSRRADPGRPRALRHPVDHRHRGQHQRPHSRYRSGSGSPPAPSSRATCARRAWSGSIWRGSPSIPIALSPSSERYMHCAVYRARPEVEAIIHAHAPYAIILADTDLPFLPISTEAAFLGDVGRVPFIMPGTKELAKAVAKALGKCAAVLMQNHGILVAASSLRRAADQAEVVERTSQVILGCYAVGKEPTVLPDDILETLRQVGGMMG